MTPSQQEFSEPPTFSRADRRIARRVARRLSYYAMRPADIGQRLAELDREWPVDRMLQAHAATLTLGGLLLGVLVDRRLLLLPAAVAGVLLQHALRGWCPPLPLLRGLGARTAEEIALERYALKALRGDFRAVPQAGAWLPAIGPGAPGPGAVESGAPAFVPLHERAAAAMRAAGR